jgi:DNA-directed RNA polymerase specialized sigma24 family protein
MGGKRTDTELREFYEHWASVVNTFCRLYLGHAALAENAVEQGFLQYFRRELPLRLDHLPTGLMSLTLGECDRIGGGVVELDSGFEAAVLGLLPEERAVFILHGVLNLQLPWVAAVMGTPYPGVCQLWVRALVQLRMFMVHDKCSRLFDDCGLAPESSRGASA